MVSRREKVKARIRDALRRYARALENAVQRNSNEADTSGIVYDMLGDVLGWDKYLEVTGEYKAKGQYADYAVKVDGSVKFFVEVKAIGTALNQNHLRQVTTYAVNEGVEWVVLTNARIWQVYHVEFEKPIVVDLAFEVDLLSADRAAAAEVLYLISKEGMAKDEISTYWADKLALSAPNIVRALFTEDVINEMRQEFKQLTGRRLSPEDIRRLLVSEVLRPELGELAAGLKIASRPRRTRGRPPADVPSEL